MTFTKNKKILFGILSICSLTFSSCSKVKPELSDATSVKTEIEAVEASYAKGLETRDIEMTMAYYGDDIQSFESESQPIIGKAALRKEIETQFKKMPNGVKLKLETKDVIVSSDAEQVVETGTFSIVDDKSTNFRTGNFIAVFVKKDGKYQCVREMMTPDVQQIKK